MGRDVLCRSGRAEALAEQDRQVVCNQNPELFRRRELPVGQAHVPDPLEQLRQSRVTTGRRRLDVHQPRFVTGGDVLVLQPGDGLAGSDPAVLLPVDAQEDVALPQVGQVEILRGDGGVHQLEQDRSEVKPLHRLADGNALGRQLLHRGTDEDPDSLVGIWILVTPHLRASSVATVAAAAWLEQGVRPPGVFTGKAHVLAVARQRRLGTARRPPPGPEVRRRHAPSQVSNPGSGTSPTGATCHVKGWENHSGRRCVVSRDSEHQRPEKRG
jgi:hypothetical protein